MKVLFIGNSHTYFNDMPRLFAEMTGRLTGEEAEVTMLAYSGRSLAWHMEEYLSLRFALLYGSFDYCVIQQQAHPFPGEETTAENAKKIMALCRAGNAKPVLCMTWAERGKPENAAVMSSVYRRLAEETGALLAPVGELFETVQKEHPSIDLYYEDGAHASPAGDYLIAAVYAALLTKTKDLSPLPDTAIAFRLPDGSLSLDPASMKITLDPDAAAVLRGLAESVVK